MAPTFFDTSSLFGGDGEYLIHPLRILHRFSHLWKMLLNGLVPGMVASCLDCERRMKASSLLLGEEFHPNLWTISALCISCDKSDPSHDQYWRVLQMCFLSHSLHKWNPSNFERRLKRFYISQTGSPLNPSTCVGAFVRNGNLDLCCLCSLQFVRGVPEENFFVHFQLVWFCTTPASGPTNSKPNLRVQEVYRVRWTNWTLRTHILWVGPLCKGPSLLIALRLICRWPTNRFPAHRPIDGRDDHYRKLEGTPSTKNSVLCDLHKRVASLPKSCRDG